MQRFDLPITISASKSKWIAKLLTDNVKPFVILARYLSYTISKLGLNPTTFYFKIRYEYGLKNSQSITENRLFNEYFLINLAKTMIRKLDNHLGYKIHYIAISASNFAGTHNYKTFSLVDYEKDLKFASLNEKLLKVRDKYGIDIVKYGKEII